MGFEMKIEPIETCYGVKLEVIRRMIRWFLDQGYDPKDGEEFIKNLKNLSRMKKK